MKLSNNSFAIFLLAALIGTIALIRSKPPQAKLLADSLKTTSEIKFEPREKSPSKLDLEQSEDNYYYYAIAL